MPPLLYGYIGPVPDLDLDGVLNAPTRNRTRRHAEP